MKKRIKIVVRSLFFGGITLHWEEYETKILKKNNEIAKYTEDEINELLKYAKKLYVNQMPVIYDINHLSKMVGVINSEIIKIINSKSKFYYREYPILKKSGGEREIKAPLPTLDIIQKWIFNKILSNLEPSVFCKSYQKGLTIKDNAKFHRRQKIILKMDITDFFNEVSFEQVNNIFIDLGYTFQVSKVLTDLVMYSKNGKLRKGLPQGASTSPMLSNLILKKFDEKIGKQCIEQKIRYTRYADDLTFSGDFDPKVMEKKIRRELLRYGFEINNKKTKILRKSDRQIVTGIVVNDKMQAPRKKRKNLRLEIYFLLNQTTTHFQRKGLNSQKKQEEYFKIILGKVNFILQVNPLDKEFKKYKKDIYRLMTSLYKDTELDF